MRPSQSEADAVPATAGDRPEPYALAANGVRLRVHVTPRAGSNRVGNVVLDGRTTRLRLAVTAPPHDGEANAAVIALLARSLRLPKSAFAIAAGAGSRDKTIAIHGDAAAIAAAIEALLAAQQGERR